MIYILIKLIYLYVEIRNSLKNRYILPCRKISMSLSEYISVDDLGNARPIYRCKKCGIIIVKGICECEIFNFGINTNKKWKNNNKY